MFDIVDIAYPYNEVIGTSTLNAFIVTVHSSYLSIKIPNSYNFISMYGSQEDAKRA